MRKGGELPESFSEYETAITVICSKTATQEGGFVYESAKDVLKWNSLSVKEHIYAVMSIGNLLYLDDKGFDNFKNKNNYSDVTKEELLKIYKDYKDGNYTD